MDAATKTGVVPPATTSGDGVSQLVKPAQPVAEQKPVADQKALSEKKPQRARQDDRWKIFSGTANDALA